MKRLSAAISSFAFGLIAVSTVLAETTVVNHLTMNQWVQSTEDGSLQGRVVLPKANGQMEALAGVTVAISSRNGEVLRATTNESGEFTVADVQPGVYALTARGDNVFACCAMHVISAESKLENKFPQVAEVSVANVDYTVVNTAVIRYLPPNVRTADVSIASAELESLASKVCGNEMFRVAQSEGGMNGRLHLAGAKGSDLVNANLTNVFLFKDAMEIDRALTDQSGRFSFDSIEPGQYSLLAIGPGGVGLIGFELVDEAAAAQTAQSTADAGQRLVGLGHGGCCCPEFAMQIAPMPEMVSCVEEVIVAETIVEEAIVVDGGCGALGCGVECEVVECCDDGFGTPLAGGGFYGAGYGGGYYGGGGGGYGGGGGGFGGIGALAGLGAIAAAASNDNGGGVILPPVVASPSGP